MKASVLFKSGLLATALLVSSCATTHYSEDQTRNNFSNLQSGKKYAFSLRESTATQKMIFTRIEGDEIVGYKSKKDSTIIRLEKRNVHAAKDIGKARVNTGAAVIGTLGAAALIFSASRAD